MPNMQPEMSQNVDIVDAGFEALLRPIQDVLTKNWGIRLAKYLQNYLCHLKVGEDPNNMNFSEAALVVQNSTHFYCKRVDLVFDFMTKLINVLQRRDDEDDDDDDHNNNEAGKTGQSKKKKSGKLLRSEGLTLLDFVFAEQNIDFKWEKKPKSASEKKTVVLNTSVKVPTKENIKCKLYNSKGLEMGYKNEYRLHWRIHSDGMLKEDFCGSSHSKLLQHRGDIEEPVNSDDESMCDRQMDIPMADDWTEQDIVPIPEQPAMESIGLVDDDSPPAVEEPPPPEHDPLRMNIASPKTNKKKNGKNKKTDLWEILSTNLKVNELKIRKRQTFSLPKGIIEGVIKSRKRKRDNVKLLTPKEVPTFVFHHELSGEKEPVSSVVFGISQENAKKSDILRRRRLENQMAVMRAAKEFADDLGGFYSDNEDEDFRGFDDCSNDDENVVPDIDDDTLPKIDVGLIKPTEKTGLNYEREEAAHGDTYERDAYLTMQKYKQGKVENANMVTEIARRVQAWHESIQPILAAAEMRTKFDIHHYGTHILDKFTDEDDAGAVKSFTEITKGLPKNEISRYFLSTLMLANTYNVEIIKTDARDLSIDCINIRLLNKIRHLDEMDDNLRVAAMDCGH